MKKGLVVTTILALVAVLAAGCAELAPVTPAPTQPSGPALSTGTIRVLVTDAPSYEVVNVAIHFLKVEVHKAADGPGGDEGWIPIPLDFSDDQTFDEAMKIDLNADMGNVILAEDQVEAGKYTQIRVYMDEGEEKGATVTYIPDPDVLDENDEPITKTVDAKLPSGTLRFVRPFEVAENGETLILLDFDLQKSVVFTGASQSEDVKVIVKPVVKLQITLQGGQDNRATLLLENKDPDTWEVIDDDTWGKLTYNLSGETFDFEFEGEGLEPETEYSLIYYADYEDRFNVWGGDNPGALIATMATDVNGDVSISDSVELDMDLPHPDDANADINNHDYSGSPDYYTNATGAKIWLVPSEYYNEGESRVTSWEPDTFLFETDLITYDDTD